MTFDCHVHFYETIKTDKEANDTAISWNTLVIPDVQEPFLPTSASSLLMDDPKLISRLLEILPTVYQNSNITHGALGTALNLAGSILEANGGQI